jgi:NAD(P)-dependent dehydrogenase (short-subunit alcohol dehydrogenase family)
MKLFEGKTALVMGRNSGIGLATALAFVIEGVRGMITGRDQAKRLKGLDQEDLRPKRIVADHVLDLSILKEVYFCRTPGDDGLRDLVRREPTRPSGICAAI